MTARLSLVELAAGAGLGAALLALAACHPPHVRHGAGVWSARPVTVAASLTCPPKVGRLTRIAQAADGQTCDYAGPDGEDVSLRRVALNDQPAASGLPGVEAELRPLVPARQGPDPAAIGDGDEGDKARVDLPGIHVNAQGDQAEVHVFGVTVHAKGENADVDLGQGAKSTSVQAGLNGAEVRVRDVGATNAQLVFVLAADRPGPSGYAAVGYLARGPAAGPLVAAVFKAREGRQDWRGDRDINQLLRLNVKQSAPR